MTKPEPNTSVSALNSWPGTSGELSLGHEAAVVPELSIYDDIHRKIATVWGDNIYAVMSEQRANAQLFISSKALVLALEQSIELNETLLEFVPAKDRRPLRVQLMRLRGVVNEALNPNPGPSTRMEG